MNFVVRKDALALRVEEEGAVVWHETRSSHLPRGIDERLPLDHPYNEWALKLNRQARCKLRKLRVLERKRRRGFRPHQQNGMIAGGREAQALDLFEVIRMCGEPVRFVRGRLRKIQLYRPGYLSRWRDGNESWGSEHE